MSLYADDLAKSQQFYSSLLGWVQSPAGGVQSGVRFYANPSAVHRIDISPQQGLENRLQVIGFSTSDAEALRRFLAANGVTVPFGRRVEKDGKQKSSSERSGGKQIDFCSGGTTAPKAPKSEAASIERAYHSRWLRAHDRAVLDHFYKDLLGFHLLWPGGSAASHTDWVMMQVPDGTDWLEYMLYLPAHPSRDQLAVLTTLPGRCQCGKVGRATEGATLVPSEHERLPAAWSRWKVAIDLVDPDGTRVEFMEFEPAKEPCCAPFHRPTAAPSGWLGRGRPPVENFSTLNDEEPFLQGDEPIGWDLLVNFDGSQRPSDSSSTESAGAKTEWRRGSLAET